MIHTRDLRHLQTLNSTWNDFSIPAHNMSTLTHTHEHIQLWLNKLLSLLIFAVSLKHSQWDIKQLVGFFKLFLLIKLISIFFKFKSISKLKWHIFFCLIKRFEHLIARGHFSRRTILISKNLKLLKLLVYLLLLFIVYRPDFWRVYPSCIRWISKIGVKILIIVRFSVIVHNISK